VEIHHVHNQYKHKALKIFVAQKINENRHDFNIDTNFKESALVRSKTTNPLKKDRKFKTNRW